MGLHVGVLGPEVGLGVLAGQRLDLVHHLAAGVHAPPGHPLGVLVRQPVPHGQQHGGAGVVLRRDQLQLPALSVQLLADEPGHVGLGGPDHPQAGLVGGGLIAGGHGRGLLALLEGSAQASGLHPTGILVGAVAPRWLIHPDTPVTTERKSKPPALRTEPEMLGAINSIEAATSPDGRYVFVSSSSRVCWS